MTYPGQPRIRSAAALALHLRRQIADGVYRPGQRIPSEDDLRATYGLAIGTINRAVGELRRMGIVDWIRGYGVVVREPREIQYVQLEAGSTIEARPSTTEEQDEWGEGVSAIVVTFPDGTEKVYPGDRTMFRT